MILNTYLSAYVCSIQRKVIPEHESPKTQEKSSAIKLAAPDQAILKKLHDEMRKLSQASSKVRM